MEASEEVQTLSVSRLHRPESSASTHLPFTPQSSNSSSANLQYRRQSGMADRERVQDRTSNSQRESPGASLLQERLKEKKVARLSERHQITDVEVAPDNGISKILQTGVRPGSRPGRDRDGRPSSSGGRPLPLGKKGMGLKEMEDQVSTLHKQNFDLKLELFHRRQRQSELEERIEAAEAQIAAQAEMQAVNEQLLAELEKRDQAVEEAVGIICALEEKIDKLSRERTVVRSYDAQYESDYFRRIHGRHGQSTQDPSSSPLPCNEPGNAPSAKPSWLSADSKLVARMPSFLSEQSEGAEALRSLYLPSDRHSQSLLSLPKLSEGNGGKDDNEEADALDSPRLSVLSESSFLSVYGDKRPEIEDLDLNNAADKDSPDHQGHRKSTSVEKWVQERAKAANSTPRVRSTTQVPGSQNEFPSIINVLESPLQRLERMERKLSRHSASVRLFARPSLSVVRRSNSRHEKQKERDDTRKTEMTTFGHQQALPPTPDTISTDTLRRFKGSNDNLGRGPSREEQGPENGGHRNSASNVRPHSAGETVTSRREGHGWDTVTQSEFTETNSDLDVELPKSFDPWIAMGRERRRPRIQPPDMFTFGSDDDDDWGRDMMFNGDAGCPLPQLRDYKYSGQQSEEPRSVATVTTSSHNGVSGSTSTQGTIGIGNQSPDPPERKSSLAHSPAQEKKQRRPALSAKPSLSHHNAVQATTTTTVYADNMQNNPKRNRLASKLFNLGRSDLPLASAGAAKASAAAPNLNSIRSYTDYVTQPRGKRSSIDLGVGIDGLHGSSATPPPIARYPRSRGVSSGGPVSLPARPMSASSLDSNVPGKRVSARDLRQQRRGGYDDGYGVDGAGDKRPAVGAGKAQGKKGWFGLGKTASLRR